MPGITPQESSSIDERLPEYISLDPYRFYESRAYQRSQQSDGIEYFVYKIFGPEVIASLAFAIDPFTKVPRISRIRSIPKRTQKRKSLSIIAPNTSGTKKVCTVSNNRIPYSVPSKYYWPIPTFVNGKGITAQYTYSGSIQNLGFGFSAPPLIPWERIDSTASMRPKWAKFGDSCTIFKNSYPSSPLKLHKRVDSVVQTPSSLQATNFNTWVDCTVGPIAAYLPESEQLLLRQLDERRAEQECRKHGPRILSDLLPKSEVFSSIRAILELKDFAGVGSFRDRIDIIERIKSIREQFKRPSGSSELYLQGQFGLIPLVSDIVSILRLPDQVSKRFNFLRARSGKDTWLRLKSPVTLETPDWKAPFFKPYGLPKDFIGDSKPPQLSVKSDLWVSALVNFEFPDIAYPSLSNDVVRKLYGANLTVSDVYNLVPWTWLIDWFTGFGSYLNTIERFHTDDTQVKFGFITYKSKVTCSQLVGAKWVDSFTRDYRPNGVVNRRTDRSSYVTAQYTHSLLKRFWLNDLGVASTSLPSSLSTWKESIILALVGQRLL